MGLQTLSGEMNRPHVLIACEESQVVCAAFRARGIEAFSCDVQAPSGGYSEWHILGDALHVLAGGTVVTMDGRSHIVGNWDLLIAHPPCTYLTSASAVRLFNPDHSIKDLAREQKGWEARNFFMRFYDCDIPRIAVENPVPLKMFNLPKYDQIINPNMFGDPWLKRTGLWLRNLPNLAPTDIVEPLGLWVGSSSKQGKSSYVLSSHRNSKQRAKTFPGIAVAMAKQWGDLLLMNGGNNERISA